ncbi:hypothetical protein HCN44_006196 [Aphidius gifuensis]|uniref:Uncharacterized protein n=1 Tax=Aphidius gifuensis TaxID=684658 RepID=A0A835CYG6_APHGI|nr:hypothetical protein HCN44_006196 [Aphidius gifuensis]
MLLFFIIFVCAVVCISFLESSIADDKSTTTEKDFLPISATIEGVISPDLLKELQDRRPSISSVIQQIASSSSPSSTTTEKPTIKSKSTSKIPRKFRTTTTPSPITNKLNDFPGFDLARAQQVRQENQYPFDIQNRYNNFPNFNPQSQYNLRQYSNAFNGFGNRNLFNANLQTQQLSSLIDGSRIKDNTIQGNDRQSQNGDNRLPYGGNGGGTNFDYNRFRGNFGNFGYDDRFGGRLNEQGYRNGDDNFGYSNFGQQYNQFYNPNNNYRQDFRTNYPFNLQQQQQQNGLRGNQGFNLQGYSGNYPFQGLTPNNQYDNNYSPRYPNQYGIDDYGRGGQRGFNYQPFNPDTPGRGVSNGNNGNQQIPNQENDNPDADDNGSLTSSSKKTEIIKKLEDKKINNDKNYLNNVLPIDSRLPKLLFYPQLDDYSDVRYRPDGFKQFFIYPSIPGHKYNNDDLLG